MSLSIEKYDLVLSSSLVIFLASQISSEIYFLEFIIILLLIMYGVVSIIFFNNKISFIVCRS